MSPFLWVFFPSSQPGWVASTWQILHLLWLNWSLSVHTLYSTGNSLLQLPAVHCERVEIQCIFVHWLLHVVISLNSPMSSCSSFVAPVAFLHRQTCDLFLFKWVSGACACVLNYPFNLSLQMYCLKLPTAFPISPSLSVGLVLMPPFHLGRQ